MIVVTDVGIGKFLIFSILARSVEILSSLTIYSRNFTGFLKRWHFFGFTIARTECPCEYIGIVFASP